MKDAEMTPDKNGESPLDVCVEVGVVTILAMTIVYIFLYRVVIRNVLSLF